MRSIASLASRLLPPLLVLTVALVNGRHLLGDRLLSGHDTLAHVPRAVEYHQNIRHGIFPPRWAPDLAAGFGEPLFVAAPPLVPAVTTGFHLLGTTFVRGHNLTLLLFYTLGGLVTYAAGALLAGSAAAGVLAAVAFLEAPYVHLDLFVRGAAPELAGLSLLPLVVLGAVCLARDRHRRGMLAMALGVGGIALAHSGMLLLGLPLALLLTLGAARARASGPDERLATPPLAGGLRAMAIGLLLGASTWLPALAERGLVHVERLREGYYDFHHHFVHPTQLLSFKWAYGFSIPGKDDGMSFSLGPVHVLLVLVGLVTLLRSRDRATRTLALTLGLAAAAAVLLTLPPSAAVWEHAPFLRYLSYPWRLLAIPAVTMAPLTGLALLGLAPRRRPWAALAGSAVLLLLGLPHALPQRFLPHSDADYTPERIAEDAIEVGWAREFLPRTIAEPPRYSLLFGDIRGNGKLLERRADLQFLELELTRPQTVWLNLLWYPGWTASVDNLMADPRPLEVLVEPGTGRLGFALGPGKHLVTVLFTKTRDRMVADLLSVLGAVLVVATVLWPRSKARPQTVEATLPGP